MSKRGDRARIKERKRKAQLHVQSSVPSESAKVEPPYSPKDNLWRKGLFWFINVAIVVALFGLTPGEVQPYSKAFYILVISATIAVVWLWLATQAKAIKLVSTPFFLGVGVWLAAKLITTFTSMLPVTSFWGTYNVWAGGFVYGLAVAVMAAVIITLRLETGRIVKMVHILGGVAIVFSGMTIYQAIHEGFFYQKVRPESPLLNADFFISFLLLFIPLAIVLLAVNINRRQWVKAIVYAVSSLIFAGALFVSLPTHMQTILLPAFMNGKPDTTSGAIDTKSITAANFAEDNSNLQRWTEWGIGLKLGSFNPLVGTGPSTTADAFINRQHDLNLKTWDHNHIMGNPHNDLIEQFSQEGLLGLAAYLFLWGVIAWLVYRNRSKVEPQAKPYAIGIVLGLLFWFGFNQLLFTAVIPGIIVWVWIALLMTLVHASNQVEGYQPKVVAGVFALGLVAISVFIIKGYIDDAYVNNAESMNSYINSGSASSLSPTARTNIAEAAATQENSAASDLPYVAYYANHAAVSDIDLYINSRLAGGDNPQLGANALKYGKQAVTFEPYSPEYVEDLGGIEYTLSAPGSAAEKSGLDLMNRAINMTPETVTWYGFAAEIVALKNDYPLANSFIERGLAASSSPSDHATLQQIANNLVAQASSQQ